MIINIITLILSALVGFIITMIITKRKEKEHEEDEYIVEKGKYQTAPTQTYSNQNNPKSNQEKIDYVEIARGIKEAIAGLGTDEEKLFDNLHKINTKKQFNELKEAYRRIYNSDMEKDILNDLTDSELRSNLPKNRKSECMNARTEVEYYRCLINNLK